MPEPGQLGPWLTENGIGSVRLQATNHDGLMLGKYLSAAKFLATAERGSQLADTAFGVDFSGDVALGWDWGRWRGEVTDVTAVPDLDTLTVDPALAALASVICDFTTSDGEPVPVCCRSMLIRLIAELGRHGLELRVAPELEF